ncbi:MAG: rod shape-determining protein MreD [Acutalibacter sp.]
MIRDLNKLIRYLAYVLELLVLFMLQETPGLLPSIFGARPVLLFPAVVAIAMLEPEVPALLFGVVGGLFCDFGLSGMLGFHALVLGVLCFFISLVIRAYLQNNMATAILTGVWSIGLVVLAQWFFLYFFQYSYPAYALTHHYLPKYFYTLLFLPLLYLLNRGLSQALGAQEKGTL